MPSEVKKAFNHLNNINLAKIGCGYWVVEEEGKNGVDLTKELNSILFGESNDRMNALDHDGTIKTKKVL